MLLAQGVFGLVCFIALGWLFSEQRRQINPRIIISGLAAQLLLALLLLKTPGSEHWFTPLTDLVNALQAAAQQGSQFVFGYIAGGKTPFELQFPQHNFILTFQALPLLIVVSALSALLFHWRLLPLLLQGMSWLLQRTFRISAPLGLGTAANVFVGMTEAPLLIRPCLAQMSRSELFALMVTGMATLAGTVMVLYATFLNGVMADPMRHILTASLISAPASLLVAHLLVPGDGLDGRLDQQQLRSPYHSSMDAVTTGTLAGLQLWLNVVALLLVLVALVALANMGLGLLPDVAGEPLTFQRLLGWLMAPLAWLTGIPWPEARIAGSLLGIKTILNEMIAYLQLIEIAPGQLSDRSVIITTYALCGFANISSLGILIGGLTYMAPQRGKEITALGWKALAGGTLATLMTAAIVGLLI
ncbi:NupC/NupG family nucleoside CNT transporter [Oceanobacter mangrovi]|uniref:NupC/NupG family nucleoside CNT transporter n=1 Tax=Oceanobacter mangrovi TaxID=2862510 RepID=UPI001C8EDB7D|nr:nucleoside transporter C-terminal domain-containing protein [Oceanobacter mangrovi]